MEELQVIETTSGRQFKPWASREDVQAIEQAVEQAVQDPASITAITSEIASGKQVIAQAINAKGGEASATESFTELAQDIQYTLTSGILASGVVQTHPFEFLPAFFSNNFSHITEIIDTLVEYPSVSVSAFTSLQKMTFQSAVKIPAGNFISGTLLQEAIFPKVAICTKYWIGNCPNLTNLVLGKLIDVSTIVQVGSLPKLRNITVGQDTNIDLFFNFWTAAYVIAEGQSGIDELNSNLYNNLLTKLYDHSQDGVTRTLSIGWLANVTAENIAYANAKGWTLTT